ncbi:hydrogenase maturation nickel metallochaperone HypA [Natronomonas sp.]|uniref:hydrogenase maturation nickel metallochaperone HypA/HybF n=1 Tax=Natronomonas sp. TaxID=2184060 RepID=UPI00262C2E2F|nr:hydrogenase maturation nickel metallochaperone HypA [Natronomonas sp.]
MHELTAANRLLEAALEAASERNAGRIDRLTVELGTATHLTADQLRFCLDAITEGTAAAEATVEFDRVEPAGACECGWSGPTEPIDGVVPDAPSLRCPDCGRRLSLRAGRECRLSAIEIPERTETEQ